VVVVRARVLDRDAGFVHVAVESEHTERILWDYRFSVPPARVDLFELAYKSKELGFDPKIVLELVKERANESRR
jgi:hypothetical protein